MTSEQLKDLDFFMQELGKKIAPEVNLDEWGHKTLDELRATDYMKCVVCGLDKAENDMQKVFKQWENGKIISHKGICKRCWTFDGDEEGE